MIQVPKKVLASGWKFEVETETPDEFVEIKGINSFTPNPTLTTADGTDFQSGGMEEHTPATRGLTITLSGFYLENKATGERDPGQLRCEELSSMVDVDAKAKFRMTSPGGTTYTFNASFNVTIGGGGTTDNTQWSCEVTRDGPMIKQPAA